MKRFLFLVARQKDGSWQGNSASTAINLTTMHEEGEELKAISRRFARVRTELDELRARIVTCERAQGFTRKEMGALHESALTTDAGVPLRSCLVQADRER